MNYQEQLRDAEKLIAQGLYVQAVRTAGSILEGLYKDLYRDLLGHLPPAEREKITQTEQRIGGGKPVGKFTLGQLTGLYREAKLIPSLEKHLGLSLPFMKSFNPTYFVDLRNRATHEGAQIAEDEAQLSVQQLRMLLRETGRLAPSSKPKPTADTAMMLKPWPQVATPHEDILRGELEMSTYAADLWAVARQDPVCPRVYRGPRAFFQATYLTSNLRSLLKDALGVLTGGRGDRVLQLRTPFGGGKTHSLIALYHLAHSRQALADFEDLADLPDPGPIRVAVLHGLALDPHVPRQPEAGAPFLRTLWGELAWQLGGAEAYTLVQAQDQARTAPGSEVLRQLLDGPPTLILLDEVLVYVQKAYTIPIHDSTLGRQTIVFLQTLTEVVRGLRHAAMVYSLQASVHEVAGDEALLSELDHLVTRVDAKREPVSGDEVMRVVQHRLFQDLGDESVRREVARAYAELYRRFREGMSETESERREASREAEVLEERVLASYPFHPDLLDLMNYRWGGLPNYQRTRGALQFLATVVHALWHDAGQAQPLIGPGDVPLHNDAVRNALFSQVGEREHWTSVLEADLIGTTARVHEVDRRVGQESPALQHLRVGTRLATAAFLYSFGARKSEERGVLESELIAACLAPGLDRMVLTATLSDLREYLLYLWYTARRYRFETRPNLNKLIADEARKWRPEEVLDRIRDELAQRLNGGRGAVLWPQDSSHIPDREPEFKVVYPGLEWAEKTGEALERDLRAWLEQRGNVKREYLNALAFALPAHHPADQARDAARQLLAIESLLNQKKKFQFSDEQVEELGERQRNAITSLDAALRQLYAELRFPVPDREGEAAYRLENIDLRARVSTIREIHGRTLEALRNWVFDYVTPDKLIALTRLGQPAQDDAPAVEHLPCEQVVAWFFSYLDFPKLLSTHALQRCVANGVADRTFGYVVGVRVDEEGHLQVDDPRRIRFGDRLNPEEVDLTAGAYLLSADLARHLITPPVVDKGMVAGQVWLDADRDGVRGDEEQGLAGVAVVFEQDGVEIGRAVTGPDGRYVSPPLPPGKVKVLLEAGPDYEPTTAGTVEVPVEPQAPAAADFGVWMEEPKPGVYRLRLKADKAQTFIVFRVLQNLSDKAKRLTVTFDIEAEAEEAFDPIWLRNAVEEPLDEADVVRER